MLDMFKLMRGPVRHMKLIGQHEEHKALRLRNELRLSALRQRNMLYEREYEKPPQLTLSACLESLKEN
jgi:hypothetical protein